MTMTGIQLELLLGRRVLAKNGKSIGRLEEIVAGPDEGDLAVTEYHVGTYGALERLSASASGARYSISSASDPEAIVCGGISSMFPTHIRRACYVRSASSRSCDIGTHRSHSSRVR